VTETETEMIMVNSNVTVCHQGSMFAATRPFEATAGS
jgi:hypothetical protein